MVDTKENTTEQKQADLVIIGAGAAGLTAAVAASEQGAQKIIILETRGAPGGNASFVGGIFAAESGLQKRLGIDASTDLLFKKAMGYSHWRANPRLIRALVDKSGDTISWLEAKGLSFDRILPLYPNQVPMVFHFQQKPSKTGAMFVKTFVKQCEDRGISIVCRTKACQLLTSNSGRVIGVMAETGAKQIRIAAKSVITATGGFAGNSDLMVKYLPDYNEDEFNFPGIAHNGDGLQMATDIGAASEGLAVLEINGPAIPGAMALTVLAHQPHTLWVNRLGERFTDEANPLFPESANSIYRQPGKVPYVLFDEKIKQTIYADQLNPLDQNLMGGPDWFVKAEKELKTQIKKNTVKMSDNWQEIAAFIGADPEMLTETVNTYNLSCADRHDEIFVKNPKYLLPLKTPPYYAIRGCLNIMATHGGIKINQDMQALDKMDRPIAGLYAAGVETGIKDGDTYDAHLTGHSFGFSVSSGRIAGEKAAEFIKKNHLPYSGSES